MINKVGNFFQTKQIIEGPNNGSRPVNPSLAATWANYLSAVDDFEPVRFRVPRSRIRFLRKREIQRINWKTNNELLAVCRDEFIRPPKLIKRKLNPEVYFLMDDYEKGETRVTRHRRERRSKEIPEIDPGDLPD
jgi:hypothetical protein